MALAALIVSVISIMIAVASAVYARRQAASTEQIASNDAGRRRAERTPDLLGEIEPVNDGVWHRMWLRLGSDEPLIGLTAEIIDGDGVTFTDSQEGVSRTSLYPIRLASWGHLDPGQTACWRVEIAG